MQVADGVRNTRIMCKELRWGPQTLGRWHERFTMPRPSSFNRSFARLIAWLRVLPPLIAALVVASALQGCAVNRQGASASPDVDLRQLKSFYVVRLPADERGINHLIATELGRLGFRTSTGPPEQAPPDADAIVSYEDHWQWDITMYMIELKVFVRAPRTDALLATGTSYHTSLTRKSPGEMVAEVVSNIFSASKAAGGSKS